MFLDVAYSGTTATIGADGYLWIPYDSKPDLTFTFTGVGGSSFNVLVWYNYSTGATGNGPITKSGGAALFTGASSRSQTIAFTATSEPGILTGTSGGLLAGCMTFRVQAVTAGTSTTAGTAASVLVRVGNTTSSCLA
ncbi:hypothetical protein HYH03_013107, partial [Edaphochlamys debaryana]